MTQQNLSASSPAQEAALANAPDAPLVVGDETEPDESRTPTEFAADELFTIEQAAAYLNCSATQVRGFISDGTLPAQPEGSIERVRRSDLERMGNPDATAAHDFEAEHGG